MTRRPRLLLLGVPSVVQDGVIHRISGRRNQQIAGALGLRIGQRTTADLLGSILFPAQPAVPTSSIRTYVARCRKSLGSVNIDGTDGYALDVAEDELDVAIVSREIANGDDLWRVSQQALAVEHYRAAIDTWAGDPFIALDEWDQAQIERTRLCELREHAIERELTWRLATENAADLVPDLHRATQQQPMRELRTALLMRALAKSGRAAEASRAFTRLCEVMNEELGLGPPEGLSQLDARIVRGEPMPALFAEPKLVAAAVSTARFQEPIGRDADVEGLHATFASSHEADKPRLVEVLGTAGLGKTTLVRWATRDQTTVQTSCSEAEQHGSLRPVRSLVSSLLQLTSDDEQEDLVASHPAINWVLPATERLAPTDLSGEVPDARQFEIYDAVTSLLHRCKQSMVLVFDDVQWADEQTRHLISHIGRHGPSGLTILVAARPEEMLAPLDTHDLDVRSITLEPLDSATMLRVLADRRVADDLEPDACDRLVHRSGGNPFFALELARAAADEEIGDLPRAVSEVLRRRMAVLDESTRAAVELIWAAGGELAHEALVGAIEMSADHLRSVMEAASASGIATQRVRDSTVVYDLAHDLLREHVEATIPPIRQFALHHRLAMSIDGLMADDADRWAAQGATHWHQAGRLGDPDRVVLMNFTAGLQAFQGCAFGAAEQHFLRCHDGLRWQGSRAKDRGDIDLWLARCAHRLGQPERRRALAERAFAAAVASQDTDTLAQAALAHGGDRSTYGLVNEETTTLLESALQFPEIAEAHVAEIEARLAQERHHALRFTESDQLSIQALSRTVPAASRLRALSGRIWVLNHPDFLNERIALIEEMQQAAESVGNEEFLLQAQIWMATAMLEVGDVLMLDTLLASASQLAERLGVRPLNVRIATLSACRTFMSGDLVGAMADAQHAFEIGLLAEPENANQVLQAQMIGPLRELGQLPDLMPMLLDMAESFSLAPGWECALAFALAEAGDVDLARNIVGKHLRDGFHSIPRDLAWFRALTYAAEAAAIVGQREAAAPLLELLEPFSGRNVGLWDIESGGSCDHYLGLLAALDQNHPRAIHSFERAADFNDVTGQPHRALRSRLHGLLSLAAVGEGERASRELRAVHRRALEHGFVELATRSKQAYSTLTP